jgi:hypothetical protein
MYKNVMEQYFGKCTEHFYYLLGSTCKNIILDFWISRCKIKNNRRNKFSSKISIGIINNEKKTGGRKLVSKQ